VKKGTIGRADVDVDASPAALYDLVSDVTRMGEWSPECRRCVWLDGATGPAVDARFKGSNQRGVFRWSTKPRVVVADAGREFAFVTTYLGSDMTKWTYRFEAAPNGARVTESFEMMRDMPLIFRVTDRLMGVKDRKADLEAGMGETLRHFKAAAEHGAGSA